MEENLKKSGKRFTADLSEREAGNYSPLVLAFIGDAAYELAVRTMLVKRGNASPNSLNRKKKRLVSAEAQSEMIGRIERFLTDEEHDIYRRGRNAKSYTVAKNASVHDYRRATGLEAVIGYLYLCGRYDRMLELIGEAVGEEPTEEQRDAEGK